MVHIQKIYSDKNFIKINRETNTPLNEQQTLSSSNQECTLEPLNPHCQIYIWSTLNTN